MKDVIRSALGFRPPVPPPLSDEQVLVARRQMEIARRLGLRKDAIDIQIEVLAADTADAQRHK